MKLVLNITCIYKTIFSCFVSLSRLSVAAQLMFQHLTTGWCLYHAAILSNQVQSGDWGAKVCPCPRAHRSGATCWWSSRCFSPTGSHRSPVRSSSTAWPNASLLILNGLIDTTSPRVSLPIQTQPCPRCSYHNQSQPLIVLGNGNLVVGDARTMPHEQWVLTWWLASLVAEDIC